MIGGRGGLAYLVRPDDVISGQLLVALYCHSLYNMMISSVIPTLNLQLIGLAIISSWFGCIIVTTLSVIPTQEYFFDEKGSKVSTKFLVP